MDESKEPNPLNRGVRTFQAGGNSYSADYDPFTEQGYLNGASTSRRNYLKEYGYPYPITDFMLQEMARSNTAAKRMVSATVNTTFETNPVIVSEADTDTEMLERKIAKHFKRHRFWSKWAEATRRMNITGWSALIIRVGDDREAHEPVENLASRGGIDSIVDLIPCWSRDLTPKLDAYENVVGWSYHPQRDEARYGSGRVEMMRPYKPDMMEVHTDRVIVLSETGEPWGTSIVRNSYYRLLDFAGMIASAAEGVRKNCKNSMIYEMDPTLSDEDVQRFFVGEDGDPKMVGKEMQKVAEDFNEGRETALVLRGIKVHTVATTIPNIAPYIDAAIRSLSMGSDVPARQLVGNEMGQRSSTEDNDNWHATIMSYRNRVMVPLIQEMLYRFGDWGILGSGEQDEWTVEWEALSPRSTETRAKVVETWQKVNQARMSGMSPQPRLYTDDEMRMASGLEPMTEEQKAEAEAEASEIVPQMPPGMDPFGDPNDPANRARDDSAPDDGEEDK